MGPADESLALADSPRFGDRSLAGRRLAPLAGEPCVDSVLARLLADQHDTAVTLQTAEALLDVGTPAAFRVLVAGFATTDDQTGDWITTAVLNHVTDADDEGASVRAALTALGTAEADQMAQWAVPIRVPRRS